MAGRSALLVLFTAFAVGLITSIFGGSCWQELFNWHQSARNYVQLYRQVVAL